MSDTPAPLPDPLRCAALAADLDAADLRSEPLRRLWGEEADDALARSMHEPILRAIAGDSGVLATLGRLLVLGKPQPRAAVAAVLLVLRAPFLLVVFGAALAAALLRLL